MNSAIPLTETALRLRLIAGSHSRVGYRETYAPPLALFPAGLDD
jgi:hypothetical protein